MKRSGGVTLAAVFSLLGSLATLLLGCLMLFAAVFARHSSTPTPGREPAAARSGRPMSISIIAWLLLGSLITLGSALLRFPAVFFNRLLTGWAAVLCYLAFAVVTLYLGFGLLRLNPRARVLAIYYTVFAMLNAMLLHAPRCQRAFVGNDELPPAVLKASLSHPSSHIESVVLGRLDRRLHGGPDLFSSNS
jgi:hypothetical protein